MSNPAVEGRPSAESVIHSTLNPKTFSLGLSAANLQNRKFFEIKHLVDVLEIVAKSDITSRLTPLQIETLDLPIPDCQRDDKAVHALLMTWFDIVDSAFFGGGLRDMRDRVELQHHRGNMALRGTPAGAKAFFTSSDLGKIVINAEMRRDIGTTLEQKFLGSLIHEMVHAFLYFYSCICNQCDAKRPASLGGVGITQHGPPWISSILAVAGEIQTRIYWQLDVSLNKSIAFEMKSSDWEPTLEQVTGWGLDLPLLRSHRTSLFEDEKATKLEEARKVEEARKDEEEAQEEARRKQERESLARQIAQAQQEQDQREQEQRERERTKREAEQRALRTFGLPADYLQNQDEEEVARQMAQGIQRQKAKVPRRQHSQDADPKKDEVVSLKDKVLRRIWSGVSKKR